jgi:tRNA-2-methylthio-N6-dimethylallyladenosine synthase
LEVLWNLELGIWSFSTHFRSRNFAAFAAMPSVYIKTYGCQMNERDSEAVAAQLVAKGYTLAQSEHVADVVLLNTCSVRDLAEQKALNKMENVAAEVRRNRPHVVLGFMGCMAQSRGRELIERLPDVDLVIGTQKFHRTAEYLDDIFAERRDQVVDIAEEKDSEATIREHLFDGTPAGQSVTAFVSIMQGCNQYCTFCIVPYTRGAERSRTIPDIVAECRELVGRGVREITLLGQIVTSYGKRGSSSFSLPETSPSPDTLKRELQRPGASAFVKLLDAVNDIEGLERIRFTSPHPKGYGDDLVEAYRRLPKLCESAHLPVQSGSDRILKRMHRGYTREQFLGLVGKLRQVNPEIGITTDIIVGFPGEDEADFEQTLSLVREANFDNAFVFKYSPRKGTPAATMPNPVPPEAIVERHGRVLELVNEIGREKYQRDVGKRVQVLVEGPSRKNPARLEGRTRTNRIVVFEGSGRHRGQLLDVKITRAGLFTLYGDAAILNDE